MQSKREFEEIQRSLIQRFGDKANELARAAASTALPPKRTVVKLSPYWAAMHAANPNCVRHKAPRTSRGGKRHRVVLASNGGRYNRFNEAARRYRQMNGATSGE